MERKELFKIIDVLKEQINDAINMRQEEIRGANFALERLKKLIPKDSNQVERLVITKIVEEVRFNINRLATKHFTENYEKTYLYANDVQNFSNDVRNAVLEILESNFSE